MALAMHRTEREGISTASYYHNKRFKAFYCFNLNTEAVERLYLLYVSRRRAYITCVVNL